MKEWTAGEKILAADINANFDEVSKKRDLVLGEAIAAAALVRIKTSGGAAKAFKLLASAGTFTAPTPSTIQSVTMGGINRLKIAINTAGTRCVVIYKNNSDNKGYAVVGSISGGAVTAWATPVEFSSSTSTGDMDILYDAVDDKFLLSYYDGSNGVTKIGSISGTTISFTSSTTFRTGATSCIAQCWDPVLGKYLVAYLCAAAGGSTGAIGARVGTVGGSGTTISYGTENTTGSGYYGPVQIEHDVLTSTNVIAYGDNAGRPGVQTLSITGTTINSFGTYLQLYWGDFSGDLSMTVDPTTNALMILYNSSFSTKTWAAILTVSGSTITKNSEKELSSISGGSSVAQTMRIVPDGVGNLLYFYKKSTNGLFYKTVPITNATTLGTVGSETTAYSGASINYVDAIYNSAAGPIVIYQDAISSQFYGKLITADMAGYFEDFEGIAYTGGAAGDTKTISLVGDIIDNLTGLTAGATYYIQSDGTYGTTKTAWKVGIAISTTAMIIKKDEGLQYVEIAPPAKSGTTGTSAFEDWDLSASIPAGARFADILVDGAGSGTYGVRKKGSTLSRYIAITNSMGFVTELDSARKVQRYGSATSSVFTVLGYWI